MTLYALRDPETGRYLDAFGQTPRVEQAETYCRTDRAYFELFFSHPAVFRLGPDWAGEIVAFAEVTP